MLVTTYVGNADVSREIVDKVNRIIEEALTCAEINEPVVIGDKSFNTFVRTLRCLSVLIEDDKIVGYKLLLPTPAAGFWFSSVDPFVFAEALRDIGVSLDLAVLDYENGYAYALQTNHSTLN